MKKIVLSLAILTSISFSCKNDDEKLPQNYIKTTDDFLVPSTVIPYNQKSLRAINNNSDFTPEINIMLNDIAKNIAENLDNVELRKLLKSNALLKKDGDFDIILSSLVNENSRFLQLISTDDISFRGRLEKYILAYPKLNISIPINIEKWDVEKHKILVTALDHHNQDYLICYGKGKIKALINHNVNPDQPVIVVGFNERIELTNDKKKKNANGRVYNVPTGLGLQHTTPNSFYLTWFDVTGESAYEIYYSTGSAFTLLSTTASNTNFLYVTNLTAGQKYFFKIRSIVSGVASAWSSLIASTASPRKDGDPLKVTSMKFNNDDALKVVEKWASGAPEMRLRVVVSPNGTTGVSYTTPKLEPSTRNAITDKYWVYTVPLLTSWSSANTVLRFNWREEDWNDNGTFTVNAGWEDKLGLSTSSAGTIKAGIGFSIVSDPGKDLIADTDVFYWDPLDTIYESTIFKFKLKE